MGGAPYARLNYTIVRDARINPSQKVILLALQQWGWKAHECYPSIATIADHTALGERTVQISLKRLEKFGFIKEVPDKTKPTGRKFLLLWLDNPTYLPPLKEKKSKVKAKVRPEPEPTWDLSREEVEEWTRDRVRKLIEDGCDELLIYNTLGSEVSKFNASDEQWDWYESTRDEATRDVFPAYPKPDDSESWNPKDRWQPDRSQVAQWVLSETEKMLVEDIDCDIEGEIAEFLIEEHISQSTWDWAKEIVKSLIPQTMASTPKEPKSTPPEP